VDVNDDQYRDHRVFSELDRYVDFYKSLSFSVFGFASTGTTTIYNFNSLFYSSIQGTLESIRNILRSGRINDAYALLRKYHDSAIINVYSNLYVQDHVSTENLIVTKINNWLRGTEKIPEYRVMSSYIRSSDRVAPITRLLYADDRYKKIRDRCNSHTHFNFFANALLNDNEIHFTGRLQVLDIFSSDTENLFILHLTYMFFLNEHYMTSSDYVDALECSISPEADSQYWVAPFVQAIFNDIAAKRRPDLVATIKEHTCMHLA